MAHVFWLPAVCGTYAGRMKMPDFLWLPRVSPQKKTIVQPLFKWANNVCHAVSGSLFTPTGSCRFFRSHKDSICWLFDGKPNETVEIQHGQRRDSVVSSSPRWGLFFNWTCLDLFSSNWSPKHAGGLSRIVLRECREQGKETTEDGGRCSEEVIPIVHKKPSWRENMKHCVWLQHTFLSWYPWSYPWSYGISRFYSTIVLNLNLLYGQGGSLLFF